MLIHLILAAALLSPGSVASQAAGPTIAFVHSIGAHAGACAGASAQVPQSAARRSTIVIAGARAPLTVCARPTTQLRR